MSYSIKMLEKRIEKKFVLGKYKDDFIKKYLLINGFTKHYPDRIITSIYLDTLNYNFAKDNINGVSERRKIRFRWYNNKTNQIFIEEKNKQNFQVWKNINKIDSFHENIDLIKKIKNYIYTNNISILKNNNYKIILKTNYKRSYWISHNKKIRATIDKDINATSLNNLNKAIYFSDTILEFKYSPDNENYFRNFFNKTNYKLRNQKYSKYVRSFVALENSGYRI
tara:strand:- start:736 stop:1407 length:672 start_codon:yes stop_codon:yes gene_type:complete